MPRKYQTTQKKTYERKPMEPETEEDSKERTYTFPEHQVSVRAKSYKEALNKLKT